MIWDSVVKGAVDLVGKYFPSELERNAAEAAIQKLVMDAAAAQESEITARWQADDKSDSWLAKNTRPLMLWALFFMTAIADICAIGGWGKVLPDGYLAILNQAFLAALGAYFVVRGVEKIATTKYTK